ncbi:hypothetical protein CVT26_006089 [Gymnopilus dilepis]|uniref:Plasmid pRiA4b Orf3-like domain-containing protein n=1 Tax=Gymnopilus dilepis TaxID=231916 RepID=A0A409VQ98_9AGAR|nr:hypothetical protein CVT26_006089 [Gymnopilus dilepis]
MGPWQCSHLHEFIFTKRIPGGGTCEPLSILPDSLFEDDDDFEFCLSGMPPRPKGLKYIDEELRLEDVFDPSGKLFYAVAPEGEYYPLTYVYDLGDYWEHELVFQGAKLARADRPIFSLAQGCDPVEDCHGPMGWNDIKRAFLTPEASRTSNQKFLLQWAADTSGLGSQFDPFRERSLEEMNSPGNWERQYMQFIDQCENEFELD